MSRSGIAAVRPERAFRHEAFFYAGRREFVDGVVSFIREGFRRNEPTLVVLSLEKLGWLREELGEDAARVSFADMAVVGHNPARIIPAWHDFVDEHVGGGATIRGVGEPIGPTHRGAQLAEFQQHEALLNLAFPEGIDLWLLCPYDTEALAPEVLAAARHSHPTVLVRGVRQASSGYRPVTATPQPLGEPLDEPAGPTADMAFDRSGLTALRDFVAAHGRRAGLEEDRVADLVLSVNEIAANSIQYAGGRGLLRIWQEDHVLLCEVQDPGRITDPLVGRMAPGLCPESSRGLWVVNQLCDLVQVRSSEVGTAVRMHMALDGRRPIA